MIFNEKEKRRKSVICKRKKGEQSRLGGIHSSGTKDGVYHIPLTSFEAVI